MAAGNFEKCQEVTGKWEGGWSNHKADPGGATMFGITLAKYREHFPNATAVQLRRISRMTALTIYEKDFWVPIDGDRLDAGVDLAVYDAGVNSGVSRAKKWLKASVGGTADQTVKRICAKRLGFMQSLKIWKTFGRGWSRRVADIEAKGVAWALAANNPAKTVARKLDVEAEAARKTATKQVGTGGAVGGGGALATPEAADQIAGAALAGFVVIVAIVAGVLIWRAHINKQRAAAYEAEAKK